MFLQTYITKSPMLRGIGSILNLRGNYYDFEQYLRGNVANDMRKDWEGVGNDLRTAMGRLTR